MTDPHPAGSIVFRLQRLPFLPVRAAAAVAATATVLAAGAAAASTDSSGPTVVEGVVTLPTIDDAGAATTFPLHWAAQDRAPRALIVVFHGHSHNGDEWAASGELASMARRNNALVVAPRTSETSDKNGKGLFDAVDEEGRDAASAITWARQTYGSLPTYTLCVSMGCSGLAYFIAAATNGATPDDSAWVRAAKPFPLAGIIVSEGLSNLVETWGEAAVADTTSQAEIQYETRTAAGPATPADNFAAYQARSLALLRPGKLRATGAKIATIVHDVDDGQVPFNQAVETRKAFLSGNLPTHSYTVVMNKSACSSANQTTATSYIGKYIADYTGDPTVKNTLDPTLCLSGHATETHPETTVMRVTFDVVHDVVAGKVSPGESIRNPKIG